MLGERIDSEFLAGGGLDEGNRLAAIWAVGAEFEPPAGALGGAEFVGAVEDGVVGVQLGKAHGADLYRAWFGLLLF